MVKPLRVALVVLGLAVALYGAASLTGGWLGEPPWWWRAATDDEIRGKFMDPVGLTGSVEEYRRHHDTDLLTDRKLISAGVVVAGLSLATFAAWPRRPARPTAG